MQPRGRLYGCPVEFTLSLLGGKWKTIILSHLKQSPLRYGDLQRAVPGLSDKMLTQRLHEMEDIGLIERTNQSSQVRYRLTARGRSFAPALQAMYECGIKAAPEIGARFREQALTKHSTVSSQPDEAKEMSPASASKRRRFRSSP